MSSKNVLRLYKYFQPKRYQLKLRVDPETMLFEGRVIITGQKVGRPTKRFSFHQKDLQIVSAKIYKFDKNQKKLELPICRINTHKTKEELRLHTDEMVYAGHYEIIINFKGIITKPMSGIYPSYYKKNGKEATIITTQFESHHAREAFPCVDEPEAKAVFQLELESPKDSVNLSNTPIVKEIPHGNTKTTIFEETPIMSSYLLAFVTGQLGYLEAITKNGVVVRTYATEEHVKSTEFALETAVKCLDFYEEYFDIKYPLAKCDLIALPDFASGAMENWGCITFREQVMLVDDNTSQSVKQYVALVVAHELAHQWFGNLVTMRWWTDLWLNEGFASWIEYLVCDKLFPEWRLWTQFLVSERESALKLDALEHTHPIEVPVKHPDEIRTIFDAISYSKGASVINMLHEYLSPEVFRDGLRHYLKKHSHKNTDTTDLWGSLEHVSGKPVKDFMHAWTSLPGFPVLEIRSANQVIAVTQRRFFINPKSQTGEENSEIWPIPLLRHPAHNGHSEILNKTQQKFPRRKDESVQFNIGQTGFYRTAYDKILIEELKTRISKNVSDNDRIGILSDAFETAKAGFIPTTDALILLDSYREEENSAVWDIIASNLGAIRAVIDSDKLRENMKPFVRELIAKQLSRLGWQEIPNESYFDKLLRPTILGMASVADETSVVNHALELFHKNSSSSINSINPDVRGVVYGTVARNGDEKDFETLLNMHNKATNSEERTTISASLTGFRQPELVDRALSLIKTEHVRLQDVTYWLVYAFMNRFARDSAWQWLKENWQWLEKNSEGDLGFYRTPVYACRSFSNSEFLEDFEAFFADKQTPAFERSINQGKEILQWHIAWRERDAKSIEDYFSQ